MARSDLRMTADWAWSRRLGLGSGRNPTTAPAGSLQLRNENAQVERKLPQMEESEEL